MPLREADLSATPIDDGSLTPLDDTATPSRNPNAPSNRPMSPQPKLVLFDPRTGAQETIELGSNSASSIMTLEDYKRLNRRTTEKGMITGLVGGGILTYLIKRFMPKTRTPSRNALSLTFLFSSAFISYSTSRGLLISEILRVRAQARANALANGTADMGDAPPSDSIFSDAGFSGNSPSDLRSPENESRRQAPSGYAPPGYKRTPPETSDVGARSAPVSAGGYGGAVGNENGPGARNVRDELSRIGQQPQRTRWAKGRGLEGEVEEEGEMRDPYNTPGQPRLG